MTTLSPTLTTAAAQLAADDTRDLLKGIGIPPRPAMLAQMQKELQREDPDSRTIARLVSGDVAMTAAVLRIVNSPAYGLSRAVGTIEQAVSLIGLKQIAVLVTRLVLAKAIPTNGPQLTRFWDVSAKRSHAMARLSRRLGGVEIDVAQTFGLFCDVGIPLLMQRFADYGATLAACNEARDRPFTAVEQERHHTDHALVGALMARTWGAAQSVTLAIRLHHEPTAFSDRATPAVVQRMVAMSVVAERAIQQFAGLNSSVEWDKLGEPALTVLALSDDDLAELLEELVADFADGAA
jgi:HD-like signal output (HDOD) protein